MSVIEREMSDLREIFLQASSGSQVYRGFRSSMVLADLAKRENEKALVDEYRVRTEKGAKSIDDVVIGYAMLVIVSFFEYNKGTALFEEFDLSKLEWAEEMKRLYFEQVPTVYLATEGKGTRLEDDYGVRGMETSYSRTGGKGQLEKGRSIDSSSSSASETIGMRSH